MNKHEHSPGPWEVTKYVNYSGFGIYAPGRGCIAERWYDTEQPSPYRYEIGANARLIAAAPELLEACESAQCECSPRERMSGHRVGCWFPAMREVIAKARGEKEQVSV